ncbi:MAG: pectin esterase [Mediterranea massiliensis]|nr:pectin esterase [Mediterranea massiliensis]
MKNVLKLLLWVPMLLFLSAFKADTEKPTIFMIGDSTMANKNIEGGNLERGWGQMLPGFLSEEIRVDNHAVNGRSSKSFIDEGRWDRVLELMKPGDYLFIQFGHNDEKPKADRHTEPGTTFDANLRRFVNEARAKGAIPVLFNSIVRRKFASIADADVIQNAVMEDDTRPEIGEAIQRVGNKLIDTHGAYLESPRNVAKELNVPFVDMNQITKKLVESMGPEDSKKLFLWVKPGVIPALPKGREDDTHLNVYGGRLITALTVDAIAEVVPALKPYLRHYDFVVAKDGSGDFFTLQEAINAVPDFRKNVRTTILLRPGIYKEKLVIPESKINISLMGQEGAVLSYDDYANKKNKFGENMGTSGSSSCYIYAPDFYAENITFENTSGPVGQAVACFISGDRAFFKKCRFLGFQDTLYNYGKGQRNYFEDCYIEGTVDFIFGWSTAVFNRCHIHSLGNGYVTAPATDEGVKYGYLFYDCKLTSSEGVTKVYLGRPWRPYGQSVFIQCELGSHIVPEGWHNWGSKEKEKTAFFAEYNNRGAGANVNKRVPFAHQLSNLQRYDIESVLAGDDGWNPIKNGNDLLIIKR